MIIVFLVCYSVFTTVDESSQTEEKSYFTGLSSSLQEGRKLRISPNAADTEDRVMSSLKMWRQMRRWIHSNEKDDIVFKELGLIGLTGEALFSHPNYKRWVEFEQKWMKKLIEDGVSTATFWSVYNLDKSSEHSEAFKLYVRYATMYDNEIYSNQYNLYRRPIVYYGGTKKEIFAKVDIWAKNNRPRDYVKTFLKLGFANKDQLLANPYYSKFLELTGKSVN
ncbi:Avirulence (Avh) protein [Phytophthora megakarya]|uniref:Avirulence (Avh) protein n=1 Tax=Phytophthora megakarya TaxID=4795 RepID=A0A225VK70_9STRA|nr:Avirulence (Avh) protein [Phytophthora megakarya]